MVSIVDYESNLAQCKMYIAGFVARAVAKVSNPPMFSIDRIVIPLHFSYKRSNSLCSSSVSEPPLSVVTHAILSVRGAWSYIPQILQISILAACPRSRSPHNALHSLVNSLH